MDNYIYIVGGVATLLFLYVVYVLIFKRIMFDRMLIHGGSFMLKIALLVILTPFFLTFVVTLHNLLVNDDYKVHPTENFMYAAENVTASAGAAY